MTTPLLLWLGQLAAAGLALMMLVGVGVRMKIKDTFLQTLPALGYLALNAYLLRRRVLAIGCRTIIAAEL